MKASKRDTKQSRLFARRKRGQVIVYAPFMIFFMTGFLFLSLNLGTLASKKMELQTIADVSAQAGASVQAESLQGIANLNFIIMILDPVIVAGVRDPGSGAVTWVEVARWAW